MKTFVTYLEKRRELNVSLLITCFIFLISMHDAAVNLSVFIMNQLTRPVYDFIIGIIMVAGLSAFVYFFIRNLKIYRQAADTKMLFMLIITGLTVIHTNMNFVMNIEIIHTLQFGIIALLIFPLTGSFGATLYYTVMLGAIDEWYQYSVLYPDKSDYFDFNDLVLDQLGAAFALVFLFSSGVGGWQQKKRWYLSPVLLSVSVMGIIAVVLFHFSLLSVYNPGSGNALFVLNKAEGPEDFWRHLPNCDIVYHVMTPLEGMAAIILICSLFYFMDYLALKNSGDEFEKAITMAGSNSIENDSTSASPVLPLSR